MLSIIESYLSLRPNSSRGNVGLTFNYLEIMKLMSQQMNKIPLSKLLNQPQT